MKPSLLFIIFILCVYNFSQAQLSCPAGSIIGIPSNFTKNPNGTICAGTNVDFTGQTTGNSYSWDFGVNAASTSTIQSPNYTFPYNATNQTYTVFYRVIENGTGANPDTCRLSSKPVTVNAKRLINVIDPLSYFVPCAANANIQDTTVTFTITNPFPNVNYSWDFGDGTTIASSPNASQTHHYSGFGTYPLRVWEVGFSCPGFSQPFKFYTEPVASPLLPGNPPIASYCEGTPVTILNQSVVGNASSYSWDWGDGTTYNVYDETAQTHSYNYGNVNFCGGGIPANYTGGVFVYQVKLIATNSCAPYTHQATLQVNITPKPHAEFTLPSSACVNDLITFTNATCPTCGPGIANTYSWNFGVNPNTWVVNNCATPNASFTYTTAGVYNVTLIVKRTSSACGSISDTVVHPITITSAPIVNVTSSVAPTSGCAPVIATFTNTTMPLVGVNYTWTVSPNSGYSFVAPTTSTTKNATITFTVAGTYTVTMTAQNVCGTQTYTQVITVRDKPSITNYTNQPDVCLTATSNTFSFCPIPNFLANNGTISAYSWSLDNTTISTTSSIPCQNLAAGAHTLYISCTNQCGTTIRKDTFVVKPFPNAAVTPNGAFAPNYVGCIGSNGVFDVNFANISTNVTTNTWSWSPGVGVSPFAGTSTTTANLSLHFSTIGDYIVYYSGTNSCGTDTLQYHIHIKKAPSITISTSPNTACGSLTTTPFSTILNNNGAITAYSWIFSGGTPPNANAQIAPSVTFGVGTHSIIGTATNVCGTSSDTISVTVTTPIIPVANIQTASACQNGAAITFQATPTGGTWSGTNVSNLGSGNGSFNPIAVGSNIYAIYTLGTGACLKKDTVVIQVFAPPVVNAGNDTTVCQSNTPINLTNMGTGCVWKNAAGTTITSFTPSLSGNFTLTLSCTNTNNCSASDSKIFTVNPRPTINIPDTVVYCAGNVAVALPSASPNSVVWTSPFVSGNNFNTIASGTGNFTVNYCVSNTFNCQVCSILIVKVISPSSINAGANFSICRNAPCVSLSPNPSGGTWSANVSGNQFCPLTKPTGANLLIYTFGTGTCTVKDTVIATVVDTPSVSLVVSPANVCQNGGIVTLSGGTPMGGVFSGTGVFANNQFNPIGFSNSTSTNVPLLYTYTNTTTTCTSKKTGSITINPVPVIVIPDSVVYCGGNLTVTLPIATPTSGNWISTFVTGNNFNTVASGTGFFPVVYNYNNSFGCNKKDTLIVHVISPTNINAGANFSICRNAPCVSLSPNPSGGTWSANVSGNQFCPLTKPTGANLLIYTFGTGTCTVKDTVIAMVVDTPSVSLAVSPANVCQNGGIVTLSGANPAGGVFSGTGVIASNQFNPSGFSNSVSTIVPLLYTYTNATTTCTSKKTGIITVNPVPVIVIPDTVVYCGGNLSVTLPTANPTGGTWLSTFVTGNNFNTIASGTGFFPVIYNYNNSFGCNKKDTLIVRIISAASVSAGADFSICRNANCVNLQGNPLSGTWTPAATFCPLNAPTGINQFVYSYGSGTCLVRDTLNITVNDTPLVSLNLIPKDICENAGLVQLSGNTPMGGVWSGMGVNSLGVLNPLLISGTSAVFYTFTDANTCHSIKKDSIHEHLLPNPNFSVAAMGCKNAPIPFLNVSQTNVNYSWTFGNGNTSNAINPTNIYTTIGTYNITLVATENSPAQCKDSVSHSISIIEPPIADFSAVPDSACATLLASGVSGIFVQFTNNSYGVNNSYSWTFGNFANSILATPPAIDFAQGLEDTLYMVNLVATNMCGNTQKTDSIKVIPLPKVSFGALVSSGCSPYIPTFFPVYHGSPTAYSWVIVQPTGNIVFDTSPFPASFAFIAGAQDSNYLIRVYVTNVCGIDSAETTLLVHPNTITAAFNIPYTSGCAPLSLPITNLSNAPNIVYNFGDGSATGTGSPVHVYQNAGTYILAQYADNGCSRDTLKQTIVVNAAPVVNFTVTTPLLCEDSPCQFQTNLANVSAYSWNFGDNTTLSDTSNAFNPAYNYPNAGNYSVNLTVISSLNNCKSTISQNVTIQAAPNLNIQVSDTTICQGLPIQFSDAGNGNFHSWNFGDGNVATTANSTHIYNAQGNFNVYYQTTNTIGCAKDTNLLVIVREKPVSQFISSNDEMCGTPSNIVFTNQSFGTNLGYAWTFGNGNSSTNTNTSQTYTQTGDFTVQLIAVTAFNCKDTSSKIIHIYPQPIAKDSIIPPFGCNPLTINVVNQSINGTIYSWNFGDDNTWFTGNQPPSHTYNVPDSTYILTLIANYNDKCFDSVKQSIQVARSPIANFQVKLVGDTCGGIAHPQIVNLSQFANHYAWSLGENQYSYDSIPTANYSIPDTYLIVLVASNSFNCKDTFTQSVTLHPQVNALFAADSTRGCNPFAVQFHSQSLNATTFEWDFHDGETSINENPLHVFANSGKYDVTLIASENGLCKDTLTFYQYIEVLQSPIADFVSVPVEGSPNDGSVHFYNNTVFGNTYSWDLGDGNFANERDSVLHRYYENDTFSVTLYAQNLIGCRDTVTHYIFPYLFGGLQVPNAFMPSSPVNGTEFFLPIGVGLIDYHIAVYDKWGGIIWESTLLENGKPVEGWDGTDKKGVPVMSGAYLWRVHKATFEDRREWKGMIYEKDGVPTRVGTVTVIR